jgi:hypothetical protein
VKKLVEGLLGPGSPKKISESREANVDVASTVDSALKPGNAIEERRAWLGKTAWVGTGGA